MASDQRKHLSVRSSGDDDPEEIGEERDDLLALVVGLREEASAKVILARGVAETQRRIGHLEALASLVRSFQPVMVIGILETAAYMRCVFGTPDSHALSGEEVDEAAGLFDALEKSAVFGDAAQEHLTRIADEYEQLGM